MPRTARASQGGYCYHVLNRGNGRAAVFHKDGDYQAFLRLLAEANARLPMRILAYCLMPNHFHLVLWPKGDGDLSRWMQWLMTAHVRRYHQHHHSSGHVWQGRFKAFPIQADEHLLNVLRYVEANALRAGLVKDPDHWPWCSLASTDETQPVPLHAGPVPRPKNWLKLVREPMKDADLTHLRQSVVRGRPLGEDTWQKRTAKKLGLDASLRPRGRPRLTAKK